MPIDLVHSQATRQFSQLEWLAREVVEGFITGLHRSPFHGFSVEFAEHRLYNTGESTRHIDWKLYARTEKLFVKRYEEETNLRCQLVIDRSPSMFFPKGAEDTKVTFAIQAAAALTHLLRTQRDAIGLTVFSNEVETYLPAKLNNAHLNYVYSQLEAVLADPNPVNETHTAAALHELAERIPQRSLVVVFSDLFESSASPEPLFEALQHLRYNKHEVVLFHVTDRTHELELDYDNRPVKFVDMETGESVRLNPVAVQAAYREQAEAFAKELRIRCGQLRIDVVEADIAAGFDQVLMGYLVKRSKLV